MAYVLIGDVLRARKILREAYRVYYIACMQQWCEQRTARDAKHIHQSFYEISQGIQEMRVLCTYASLLFVSHLPCLYMCVMGNDSHMNAN